jgi:hypothetical protein
MCGHVAPDGASTAQKSACARRRGSQVRLRAHAALVAAGGVAAAAAAAGAIAAAATTAAAGAAGVCDERH